MQSIQIIHVDMRRNKYVCNSLLQRYFKSSDKNYITSGKLSDVHSIYKFNVIYMTSNDVAFSSFAIYS